MHVTEHLNVPLVQSELLHLLIRHYQVLAYCTANVEGTPAGAKVTLDAGALLVVADVATQVETLVVQSPSVL